MDKIVVLGSGSWGTALAQVLADNEKDVTIWGRTKSEVIDIKSNHQNSAYFKDVSLNPNIKATLDFNVVSDANIILLAVPSHAIEEVLLKLSQVIYHKVIIINVAKGFHPDTHELLDAYIKKTIDPSILKSVVSLIGPSHAENVVERKLTAINAVSTSIESAQYIQHLFSNEYFRVYWNDDVIGSQIGVAIKNIIALASGIAEGLNLGDNARAALITRGLAEMTRFGVYFGGKAETFLGLCGVGDLVVTASSFHSRNFQAGLAIGKSNSSNGFMKDNHKTVEGIEASKIVHEIAKQEKISMPITEQLYLILFKDKEPSVAIQELMMRDLKEESF